MTSVGRLIFQCLSFLISFVLLSCNMEGKIFTAEDESRVIFPTDVKTMLAPTPTWQPSFTKVKECEAALKQELIRNDSSELQNLSTPTVFNILGMVHQRHGF